MDIRKNIPAEIEFKSTVEKAYDKIEPALKKEIIDMDGFCGFYDPETIAKDKVAVERLKNKFDRGDKETRITASVFEAIVYKQTELSNWLGEYAMTRKTCEYDDIINGVDSVIEFEQETATSYLALAVDVTYGTVAMSKKFRRIKNEIDASELATIKYFESSDGNFKGSLSNIPRVVVGADKNTVEELAHLWLSGDKADLEKHHIQLQILDEISIQLVTFKDYVEKRGNGKIARIYKKQLKLVDLIKKEKEGLYKNSKLDYRENDRVYNQILKNMEDFK